MRSNEPTLDILITSRTRVKLLMKFFLNSRTRSYLRDLEAEFGESSNAIRKELNHLEEAGLLRARRMGNKKLFRANERHPLYDNIRSLLLKHTGIDQVLERVITHLGNLQQAYVIGSFARGQDSPSIDILLVGHDINKAYLVQLIDKAETIIHRKIRYMITEPVALAGFLEEYPEALRIFESELGTEN